MLRVLLSVFLLASALFAQDRQVWVAIGSQPMLDAVAPLAKHRQSQGLETGLLTPDRLDEVRDMKPPPSYLLLLGDPEDGMTTHKVEFYRWRAVQPETYASDAPFADCPVGRMPARNPAELATMVAKTIAYEKRPRSIEDLTIAAWAGAPGYGGMVDAFATGLLVTTVRDNAPGWMSPWMISGDSKQPLCGWPPDQPLRFLERMKAGTLLNAAVAHASADAVFSMRHGDKGIWLHAGHVARMSEGEPAAPLVLLACNCAEFDRDKPTIADRLLLAPGGPVAVIGATTESHPLPNYFSGLCLLRALDGKYGRQARLGDLWQATQRQAALEQNPMIEAMLKEVEGKLELQIDVAKLRADQQKLYALLGDPALRLPLPEAWQANLEKIDQGWNWSCTAPQGATALHVGFRPAKRPPVKPAQADDTDGRRKRFEEANAAEGFAEIARLAADQPWSGTHAQPGTLRLVAIGPSTTHVALLTLR